MSQDDQVAIGIPGSLCFRCNVCGEVVQFSAARLAREQPSCSSCASTGRERAIIRALSLELFGESRALPEFPTSPHIRGIGMTDSHKCATRLAERLGYQNTYYHQEPRLDIAADQLPAELIASCDFVISSEVFEHVTPPVQRAFDNVAKLLCPGGVFILTVPYGIQPETIEHFPNLADFEVVEENGSYVLRNRTADGRLEVFRDLIFHGGPGSTLEMRVFSEANIIAHLTAAGFTAIQVHRTPDFEHGVWWPEPWSLPISARKPA